MNFCENPAPIGDNIEESVNIDSKYTFTGAKEILTDTEKQALLYREHNRKQTTYQIVQINDLHFDHEYEEVRIKAYMCMNIYLKCYLTTILSVVYNRNS